MGTKEPEEERRDHERRPIHLRVSYKNARSLVGAYTTSVSKGGCLIQAPKPLPVGTKLLFEMFTWGDSAGLKINGTVVRMEPLTGELFGIAITYDPTPDDRVALEHFLDQVLAEQRWEKERKHPRLPVNLVAKDADDPKGQFLVRDLSLGGAGLQLSRAKRLPKGVQNGGPARMVVTLADKDPCNIEATIVWTLEGRKGFTHPRVGLKFNALSKEAHEVVEMLIHLNRPEKLLIEL